jgi:hypothetical protein
MKNISRDVPLSEITLRKYEKPDNLGKRDLIRKLCLSTGLLQPGDSRDVVVDVLNVLITNKNKELNCEEVRNLVIKSRKKGRLQMRGIASSNIRRQLRRLRELFLIEKVKNNYRITEFDSLINTFEEKIEKYYLSSILERVRDYFKAIK